MPRRPITPRTHGAIDYVSGAALVAAPALLGLGGTRAGRALRAAGATHAAYSLLTRYPLGAAKVLPYRGHLALDAVAATGLAASPWLLGTAGEGRRHWLPHLVVGALELGAVALSDPSEARGSAPGTAVPTAATSTPNPAEAVMPDGAEANDAIGARTIGGG
jgi:hypothetical protein